MASAPPFIEDLIHNDKSNSNDPVKELKVSPCGRFAHPQTLQKPIVSRSAMSLTTFGILESES